MTYRVTFRKRFDAEAQDAERPETFVHVVDGVILNAVKAEVIEPPALHSQELLDEDDSFMAVGTETWDYEIADGRDEEFIDALRNSGVVLDYQSIDDIAPV